MADDTKKQLETQLWNIANTLRGKMGADEFRDYILGFIFYKYLSERIHLFADDILQHDGVTFAQIDETSAAGKTMLASIREESLGRLGYFLKPSQLFHRVAAKGAQASDNFILEDLAGILKHIEASTLGHDSEDDFEGLFEDIDLGSSKLGKTENQKNELIAKVLTHLDKIDFRLADTEADVLGDAYEYLIGQFASGAGKKAGEFYTPQEVSTILAKIVTTGKKTLKSAYDPTFGSGSLLLRVAKEVTDVGCFYGQEMNPTTYNLARMNMILHGVHYQRFDLRNEDTLEKPAPEHADLRFEAIVANPPFSAEWSASELFNHDERFSAYGKLAPKTKADFAFVQHMVHHLDTGGTMACVLPHGVLFRGAAEGHIRRYLIEECNYLDAVIGLPANIFYGTGIPTCILVLKKQRENPDDILFIDASQGFEKVGNQNQLRPADIERIVSTYRQRASVAKLSHVAKRSEVAENDFNLNVARYIDTLDAVADIDLNAVAFNLLTVEKVTSGINQTIDRYCSELGLPSPAGHNTGLLKVFKKGVMQKLFTQDIRFKDNHGQEFPDWEEKKLGQIGTITTGKTPSTSDDAAWIGDTMFVTPSDIDEDTKFQNATSRHVNGVNLRLIPKNSLMFTCIASIGKMSIATAPCITNQQINSVSVSPESSFDFVYYALRYLTPQIKATQANTTLPIINKTEFAKFILPVPRLPEQHRIADFLSALDVKIESIAHQIDKVQTLTPGQVQQMFSYLVK